jgi:8-oxo-dGTP diphosphatase
MWVLTNFGFFSIVEKPEDKNAGTLTIRARVRSDLLSLRERYLPTMTEINEDKSHDYRFRVRAGREAVAVAMLRAAMDVDYSNFKNSVAKAQGHSREALYHKVWDVLYELQKGSFEAPKTDSLVTASASAGTPVSPNTAYGGVLFDDEGRVLLVEPNKHYDNTVWTWPKGKPAGEKTAEEAALREVLEETGYKATVLARLPGAWKGTTGNTEYFLMKPISIQGKFHDETASTKWIDPVKAPEYICQTTKESARNRDLGVLVVAVKAWSSLEKSKTLKK